MTKTTIKLIALSFALTVVAGIELYLISGQREHRHALNQESEAMKSKTRRTELERDRILSEIATTQNAIQAVQHQNKYATADSELSSWLARVDRLKQWLRASPEKKIPEMQFLTSNDWLSVTLDTALNTDAKIRSALSELRAMAKMKPQVAGNLAAALQTYAKLHNGIPPSDSLQLRPYLNPQLPDEILLRYEPALEIDGQNDANGVTRSGLHLTGSGRVVLQEKVPADEDYDTWIGFTEKGGWATSAVSELEKTVDQAEEKFASAHNGKHASTPEQLLPYLPNSTEPTKLREYWEVTRR